jgi:nucleoside-diphosphate-sugar epimerase
LRPTLIYGYGKDQNVYRIAKLMRRFRVFPVIGKAEGLRQPVHCDDLARAANDILENASTYGNSYNLVGAETLTYTQMVRRISHACFGPVLILPIPRGLFRVAVAIMSRLSSFDYTIDMVDRMNADLVYDSAQAIQDFGYSAQPFLTQPERDLP